MILTHQISNSKFILSFVNNSVRDSVFPPPFLIRLMSRAKIPMRATVKPEERISIQFADGLREYTLTGQLTACWHHNPNEGKRHPFTALIMKAMGLISGVGDFTFTWGSLELEGNFYRPSGGGHIEMKFGKGKQTPLQQDYQSWCELNGVPYVICRTPTEGLDVLKNWKVLDAKVEYKPMP